MRQGIVSVNLRKKSHVYKSNRESLKSKHEQRGSQIGGANANFLISFWSFLCLHFAHSNHFAINMYDLYAKSPTGERIELLL